MGSQPSQENSGSGHLQCLKKLLECVEAGSIDLSEQIVGLPLRPRKGSFECTFMSKRPGSNPTYKVTCGEVSFVVRMKPPGVKNQHLPGVKVCVEYIVQCYVHRLGLPVPKTYCSESSADVIGTEFFIMEFADGIIFSDHSLASLQPDQRRTLYFSLMETLACLHLLPLGDLESILGLKAEYKGTAFWKWQLEMWEEKFKAACPSGDDTIQKLFNMMKGLPTPQGRVKCLLHHDFNLDNIVIDPVTCKVRAVFDWEAWCIGDPIADLAQACFPFIPAPVERLGENPELAEVVANLEVPGIPTMEDLVAHYKQCSGVDFSERDLNYAITVICLRFIPVFLDPSDDNNQHDGTKSNRREVVEFLTKAGYKYCPQH